MAVTATEVIIDEVQSNSFVLTVIEELSTQALAELYRLYNVCTKYIVLMMCMQVKGSKLSVNELKDVYHSILWMLFHYSHFFVHMYGRLPFTPVILLYIPRCSLVPRPLPAFNVAR